MLYSRDSFCFNFFLELCIDFFNAKCKGLFNVKCKELVNVNSASKMKNALQSKT